MVLQLSRRKFTLAICCAAALPAYCRIMATTEEEALVCCVCGKEIEGSYLVSNERAFCGEKCFYSTLKKCEICGNPVLEGGQIAEHLYCQQCLNTAPNCFSCGLPAAHTTQLKDGRQICPNCLRWGVITQAAAQLHYDRARKQLEAVTGLQHASVPELVLVDANRMHTLAQGLRKTNTPVSTRGIYSRQVKWVRKGFFDAWRPPKKTEQETIYLIDYLHDTTFRVAATHELMHDLIYESFPRLENAPLWVHEGICQHAAADLCKRRGYSEALYGIEQCDDPDYGDGYRYLKKITHDDGWLALRKWMETVVVRSLPAAAPTSSPL